ncbi:DNA methylase [Duncaniella freteri]|uniref:Y-family DNA polymerase n=1 Tax=Duncaniella freteri TaxID=2530391 RepID=UPI002590E819|nr:DNA methylase [Duncaniella freteri]
MEQQRQYIAIDLKSFYASVECVERGLDPLDTNMVVADASRTEKTICLAVSPSLKSYGIGGRPRLFEVEQRLRDVNNQRRWSSPLRSLARTSHFKHELDSDSSLAVGYLIAKPRMAYYIEYSTRVYRVYLRYIAPEDIHVYSIDEVFIDATSYLGSYKLSAYELARKIILDVLRETGITATAGIGTNLYLCKVAMDIVAKKMSPDKDGMRIAELDEASYRRQLWEHEPLTDFWRVGRGILKRLVPYGIRTMGDIARCSISNEALLYKLFGVNAELLIDHAWGWEPVTMDLVKAYRPESHSMCCGQVLSCAYTFEKARVVVQEMADGVALDLLEKHLVADQLILEVGYDVESLSDPEISSQYHGKISVDHYGRMVPAHAHGTANLKRFTSSSRIISDAVVELFDRTVNPVLLIRRITLSVNHVIHESDVMSHRKPVQLDLFTDYEALRVRAEIEESMLRKERRLQETILNIKKSFGKNSILKGLNFADGATQRTRNRLIGGHHE